MTTLAERLRSEAQVCWVVSRRAAMLEAADIIEQARDELRGWAVNGDGGEAVSIYRFALLGIAYRLDNEP